MTFLIDNSLHLILILLYWLILAASMTNIYTLKYCDKKAFKYYGWALVCSVLQALVAMVFVGLTCWEVFYGVVDTEGLRWIVYHYIVGIALLVMTQGLKDYITSIEIKQGENSPD